MDLVWRKREMRRLRQLETKWEEVEGPNCHLTENPRLWYNMGSNEDIIHDVRPRWIMEDE